MVCYLGEVFFGYAGRDLHGCREILQSAKAKGGILVAVKDENKVKALLAALTGAADYFDNFKKTIEDLGGSVITSP